MKLYQSCIRMVVMLVLLSFTSKISAQQTEKIRLLDQSTFLPISGAVFLYGNQTGTSNDEGAIEFFFNEVLEMQLSHISYGSWRLSPESLLSVIQNGVAYRESKIVNLYPVTVIALRAPSYEKDVLSLDYLDKMAHDGGALLTQTAVISTIRKSGNYGFDPVLRGFKYDQLNIVLNGAQCATAACPNRMDPPSSQMAPNMIDRIEVLKGPHALRYGTGFGGTINFVSSKLRFTEQSNVYGRVSSGYETNGGLIRGEGLLGFSGKNYDMGMFASWSQGNDYKSGDGSTIQADFLRGSFGTTLGLKLGQKHQVRLSATRNLARETDFAALPMDLRDDDTWLFNARHDVALNKGNLESWNTTLFGSFVEHLMDNLLKPLNPRTVNASTLATTYNYGGRTEGSWTFLKSSLFAGADLRVEGAEGTRVRTFIAGPNNGKVFHDNAWQESQVSKSGLFAEYHIAKGKMQFVLAGRMELNQSKLSDPASEFTKVYEETEATQLNPNLSIGVVRKIGSSNKLGIWLGRSQRSGSLTEKFINYFPVGQDPYEMLGNPNIDAEVNNQLDFTFEWKSDKVVVNFDVFTAYMQDFISGVIDPTLTPRMSTSPGVRRFINVDKALKAGFEINLSQVLLPGFRQQIDVAYTYGQDLEREQALPEIAPLDLRYNLKGSFLHHKLRPELSVRHVIEQSRISTEFGEKVTPSFWLFDFKLGLQLIKHLEMASGVNNLFDENYYEHLNRSAGGATKPIFAAGRSFFISLNYSF